MTRIGSAGRSLPRPSGRSLTLFISNDRRRAEAAARGAVLRGRRAFRTPPSKAKESQGRGAEKPTRAKVDALIKPTKAKLELPEKPIKAKESQSKPRVRRFCARKPPADAFPRFTRSRLFSAAPARTCARRRTRPLRCLEMLTSCGGTYRAVMRAAHGTRRGSSAQPSSGSNAR